jgi:hypothetical protein
VSIIDPVEGTGVDGRTRRSGELGAGRDEMETWLMALGRGAVEWWFWDVQASSSADMSGT